MTETDASPWLRAGLVLTAAVFLLLGLGWLDASAPDEPRYTQVAEEVRAMPNGPGDWVLLHLNGEPYDQKPPFYFWLAALGGMPTGRVSELAARLPSAVFGIAAVIGTMLLGRRMFGGRVGVVSAALLLTVYQFAHLARRAQLDVVLTALELLAFAGFWWLDRGLTHRARGALIFHGAMGLAALTKGPPGFLIPMLSVVAYLAWEGRLRDLRHAFPWWGFFLSLGPVLAWFLGAAALAPAGYSDSAVVENVFGRFFQGTSHVRPFYYFVYQFPLLFLPWTPLWILVWSVGRREVFPGKRGEETRRAWRFLAAIVGVSFVFFSISAGKRGLYMLPAFPAAALLCGDAVTRWVRGRARPPQGLAWLGGALALLAGLVGAVTLAASTNSPLVADRLVGMLHEIDTARLAIFGALSVAIGAIGVAGWLALLRGRVAVASFVGLVIGGVLVFELAIFTLLFPAIDAIRSPREIAVAAAAFTEPGQPIGLYDDRAMMGGLAYYGHRPVVSMKTPEEVADFVASGGRAIVLKRRRLERLAIDVDVVSSSHTGSRRELIVVVPRTAEGAPGSAQGAR